LHSAIIAKFQDYIPQLLLLAFTQIPQMKADFAEAAVGN
jgi:hypothetical protein